jgi:hypothetical protein
MQKPEIDHLTQAGMAPLTAEIAIEDKLIVGKKAQRHESAGDALTIDEWKDVPLNLPGAKVYFDKVNNNLLYVFNAQEQGRIIKLAIEVNFVFSKPKMTLNLARSGFKINPQALADRTRYEEVR